MAILLMARILNIGIRGGTLKEYRKYRVAKLQKSEIMYVIRIYNLIQKKLFYLGCIQRYFWMILYVQPSSSLLNQVVNFFFRWLMSGSSHIRSALIGVEYCNWCQTWNVYLLFSVLMGQIYQKLIDRLVTYKLASP